jgi:hypothetical protein
MLTTFQHDRPVFVRSRHNSITWKKDTWEYNQSIPWQEIGIPLTNIQLWFSADLLYHNEDLEAQTQVGDRLAELEAVSLDKLVDSINVVVKKRAVGSVEFNKKKCKKSKIVDKQRGLIRSFLRNNAWIESEYFEMRNKLLEE